MSSPVARLGLVARAILVAAAAAAVVVCPLLVSDFRASQLAYVAIYFIALLGLDVLTGLSGQVTLGHGAFMALGGYTTAILVVEHGVRDVWTIPLAGAISGLVGAAAAIPALRLSRLHLALATLAFAVTVPALAKELSGLSGGSRGLQLFGVSSYTGKGFERVHVLGLGLSFNHWLYALAWGIAGLLTLPAWLIRTSTFGLRLRAVRDSELAATVSGLHPAALRTAAFGISAAYAGVAGSLFALASSFVSPETFPVNLSLLLVIGFVVGGAGSLPGLVVGALGIQFLPNLTQQVSSRPGVPSIVYGSVVIFAALLLPGGVGGSLRRAASLLPHGPYRHERNPGV